MQEWMGTWLAADGPEEPALAEARMHARNLPSPGPKLIVSIKQRKGQQGSHCLSRKEPRRVARRVDRHRQCLRSSLLNVASIKSSFAHFGPAPR